SAYVNDAWRYNSHLSFNLGGRFDLNRSKDQSGTAVVRDSQWGPRVGITRDLKGGGKRTANLRLARYVAGISTARVDPGRVGGQPRGELQLVLSGASDQHGQRPIPDGRPGVADPLGLVLYQWRK